MPVSEFAQLLREFRERNGRSRNGLAHQVGVDPSYLTRIERGDREPPRRHIVEALARGLRLDGIDHSRFMVAGGYSPSVIDQIGRWDPVLEDVSQVLADSLLAEGELAAFRCVVQIICARFKGKLPDIHPTMAS